MNKGRIKVDFNELVQKDLVLLSKTDEVTDSDGNKILLSEGLDVFLYEFNEYDNGQKEWLLAEGKVELNDPDLNGQWSSSAKWCCRINKNGIKTNAT